jgi:hypothetical protein
VTASSTLILPDPYPLFGYTPGGTEQTFHESKKLIFGWTHVDSKELLTVSKSTFLADRTNAVAPATWGHLYIN